MALRQRRERDAVLITSGSPMSEGRFILGTFRSARICTNSFFFKLQDQKGEVPGVARGIVSDDNNFTCRNCGGGDRGRVAIYHPFGEFRRSKISLSPVWCSRPTAGVPLAHAAMNFVGLDLTTSDRRHQKTTTTTSIVVNILLLNRRGRDENFY
ncbi:hypothetical protein TNCV_468511 [Trichonephila clavipes]|nr:hypothetical protein TNCV_468511 [Trichonephila clavipes]